jgi:hypothetical protein
MTLLIRKRRRGDDFMERSPLVPLPGVVLGMIALANVASATMMLWPL